MPPQNSSFRRGRNGVHVLCDSGAGRQHKEIDWFPPHSATQNEDLVKECVMERGGDVHDRKDVLGNVFSLRIIE